MSEPALQAVLAAEPAVVAALGQRVYPLTVPEGTALPAAAYSLVSEVDAPAMGANTGLKRYRYQLDVVAATYVAARGAREAVKQVARTRGVFAGVQVNDVFIENVQSVYEDGPKTFRASIDILLLTYEP